VSFFTKSGSLRVLTEMPVCDSLPMPWSSHGVRLR
jgi:hypothetical protein